MTRISTRSSLPMVPLYRSRGRIKLVRGQLVFQVPLETRLVSLPLPPQDGPLERRDSHYFLRIRELENVGEGWRVHSEHGTLSRSRPSNVELGHIVFRDQDGIELNGEWHSFGGPGISISRGVSRHARTLEQTLLKQPAAVEWTYPVAFTEHTMEVEFRDLQLPYAAWTRIGPRQNRK